MTNKCNFESWIGSILGHNSNIELWQSLLKIHVFDSINGIIFKLLTRQKQLQKIKLNAEMPLFFRTVYTKLISLISCTDTQLSLCYQEREMYLHVLYWYCYLTFEAQL